MPPPTNGALLAVEKGARMSAAEKARLQRYDRGPAAAAAAAARGGGKANERLKRSMRRGEAKLSAARRRAAQAELLLPTAAGTLEAEGMERTDRFTQAAIAAAVDEQSARKAYDVALPTHGPYRAAFTADGRRLLLGGRGGHVALCAWDGFRVLHELHLRETVRERTRHARRGHTHTHTRAHARTHTLTHARTHSGA